MPEIKSKCVSVFQGGGSTAYNVCSDVLFDFDKADIPLGRGGGRCARSRAR